MSAFTAFRWYWSSIGPASPATTAPATTVWWTWLWRCPFPGMTVFAPSSAPEVEAMLTQALALDGPSIIRFPKTPAPSVLPGEVGEGMSARCARSGDGSVCILAVGKMLTAAQSAAAELEAEGIDATIWDVRVVSDPDPAMLASAAAHRVVVTAEDGVRYGGAGMFLADALRSAVACGAAPPVISLGAPRSYIAQGKPDRILAQLGLDGPGLARTVREAVQALPGQVRLERQDHPGAVRPATATGPPRRR